MQGKQNFAMILIVIGAFFIFVNALYVAASGQPIVISSFPGGSVEQLPNLQDVHGRIAFGIPGFVEGWLAIVWIFLTVFNFLIALLLLVKIGKNISLKYLGLLLSLLSFAVGGGFVFGLVMCFAGYLIVLQPYLSVEETFIGKIFRVLKLDASFFDKVAKDKTALQTGVLMLVFVNLLSGIGSGLYSYNLEVINNNVRTIANASSQDILFRIFFKGEFFWAPHIASTVFLNVGLAIIKWVIFSMLIYIFGAKMVGSSVKYEEVAKVVAFAYAPVCLQIFMPLVLVWPWLFFEWPFIFVVLTNFWFFIILVNGLKGIFDISAGRAFGATILCGSVYWFFNSVVLSSFINLPGLYFLVQPVEFSLLIVSASALIAVMMGVFRRYVLV